MKRKRYSEWVQERGRYGRTPSGAFVDYEPFDELCRMGFER